MNGIRVRQSIEANQPPFPTSVLKAWKDEIEKIAKEDWMRKASLDYDGGLFVSRCLLVSMVSHIS